VKGSKEDEWRKAWLLDIPHEKAPSKPVTASWNSPIVMFAFSCKRISAALQLRGIKFNEPDQPDDA